MGNFTIDFTAIGKDVGGALWQYGPKILLALLVLILGFKMIKVLVNSMEKSLKKHHIEISLRKFLESLIAIALKILVLLTVASLLGVKLTAFVALLGAAGLAIALSLKESLANFVGGVLILVFKPFKVGDVIEAQGHYGEVEAIRVFNTILQTPDDKTIFIPNGDLANNPISNYTKTPLYRLGTKIGIGYSDDIQKAREILLSIATKHKDVKKDPAPQVVVKELGDSSVNLELRTWCESPIYLGLEFDILEQTKLAFDKEGVSIPFPQRDVHLYPVNK